MLEIDELGITRRPHCDVGSHPSMMAAVVDMAYTAAGGGAVYASSPLQRRLRDMRALTQHVLVHVDAFATAGALVAGQEPDLMLV